MGDIKIIQVPAILEGVSPLKDGGMSLRFHTNEVDQDAKNTLLSFYQKFGWMQFSDSAIHEVPRESPTREAGEKTPSQRLRSTLYVLWQNRYADVPFNSWYEEMMENIINRVKKELPPQ